ncbi:MAG: ParB N-terminal domain-containing protein [Dyella sp.]|uniref:ParB/RepB/Spo0J family partition protein n=1 Tax=Dyella sp. TaxID=1869338 RepID=UPI003F7FE64D
MTVDRTLQRLQAAQVQRLPLSSIETDEALQPREGKLIPFREQTRAERRSEEHIGTMRLALEAAQSIDLEPVLVAEIASRRFIVDGHHRLKAYQQAKRTTIPARVLPMGRGEAVLVSKLVNCTERALEMHPEQRRDAAWQYIAATARRGADGEAATLAPGDSYRSIRGRFGIGKDTVPKMLRKLSGLNPSGFPAEKCDPGTGFPRWKAVKDWRVLDEEDELSNSPVSADQWTQLEAINVARKLGTVQSGTTPAAWKLGLELFAKEAKLEAADGDIQDFLADIADPDLCGDY